jgi:hypothetical protein
VLCIYPGLLSKFSFSQLFSVSFVISTSDTTAFLLSSRRRPVAVLHQEAVVRAHLLQALRPARRHRRRRPHHRLPPTLLRRLRPLPLPPLLLP